MPELGSLSFLYGPTLAFVAVGVLALLLRWVYATPPGVVRRPRRPGPGESRDYGLLATVATVAQPEDGARLRDLLQRHGIRATVGDDDRGRCTVLVFTADEAAARELVVRG